MAEAVDQRTSYRYSEEIQPQHAPKAVGGLVARKNTAAETSNALMNAMNSTSNVANQLRSIRDQGNKEAMIEGEAMFIRGEDRPSEEDASIFNHIDARIKGYDFIHGSHDAAEYSRRITKFADTSGDLTSEEFDQGAKEIGKEYTGNNPSTPYTIGFHGSAVKAEEAAYRLYQKRQDQRVKQQYSINLGGAAETIVDQEFQERTGHLLNEIRTNLDDRDSLVENMRTPEARKQTAVSFRKHLTELNELSESTGQDVSKEYTARQFVRQVGSIANEFGMPELMDFVYIKDKDGVSISQNQDLEDLAINLKDSAQRKDDNWKSQAETSKTRRKDKINQEGISAATSLYSKAYDDICRAKEDGKISAGERGGIDYNLTEAKNYVSNLIQSHGDTLTSKSLNLLTSMDKNLLKASDDVDNFKDAEIIKTETIRDAGWIDGSVPFPSDEELPQILDASTPEECKRILDIREKLRSGYHVDLSVFRVNVAQPAIDSFGKAKPYRSDPYNPYSEMVYPTDYGQDLEQRWANHTMEMMKQGKVETLQEMTESFSKLRDSVKKDQATLGEKNVGQGKVDEELEETEKHRKKAEELKKDIMETGADSGDFRSINDIIDGFDTVGEANSYLNELNLSEEDIAGFEQWRSNRLDMREQIAAESENRAGVGFIIKETLREGFTTDGPNNVINAGLRNIDNTRGMVADTVADTVGNLIDSAIYGAEPGTKTAIAIDTIKIAAEKTKNALLGEGKDIQDIPTTLQDLPATTYYKTKSNIMNALKDDGEPLGLPKSIEEVSEFAYKNLRRGVLEIAPVLAQLYEKRDDELSEAIAKYKEYAEDVSNNGNLGKNEAKAVGDKIMDVTSELIRKAVSVNTWLATGKTEPVLGPATPLELEIRKTTNFLEFARSYREKVKQPIEEFTIASDAIRAIADDVTTTIDFVLLGAVEDIGEIPASGRELKLSEAKKSFDKKTSEVMDKRLLTYLRYYNNAKTKEEKEKIVKLYAISTEMLKNTVIKKFKDERIREIKKIRGVNND